MFTDEYRCEHPSSRAQAVMALPLSPWGVIKHKASR